MVTQTTTSTTTAPKSTTSAEEIAENVVTAAPVLRSQKNGGLFNGQRPSIFSANRPLPRIRPPVPISGNAKPVVVEDVASEDKQEQVPTISIWYFLKIFELTDSSSNTERWGWCVDKTPQEEAQEEDDNNDGRTVRRRRIRLLRWWRTFNDNDNNDNNNQTTTAWCA